MRLPIYVKRSRNEFGTPLVELPVVFSNGDYIDLRSAETVEFKAPQSSVLKYHKVGDEKEGHRDVSFDNIYYLDLGVAIKVPKGYYCEMVARSSTPKKCGVIQANAVAIIDNSYNSNTDIWKFPVLALRDTTIEQNQRIAQFSVKLSQKATVWQKIKNLFYDGVDIIEVDDLGDKNRGGLGSSGKF